MDITEKVTVQVKQNLSDPTLNVEVLEMEELEVIKNQQVGAKNVT